MQRITLENENRPMQRYHLQLEEKKVNNVWQTQLSKSLSIKINAYLFHSLRVPKSTIDVIKKKKINILWDGKWETIKRSTLINTLDKGGIGITEVDTVIISLKTKWIKHLLDTSEANWKLIPKRFYEQFGNNLLIFYTTIDSSKRLDTSKLPEFK